MFRLYVLIAVLGIAATGLVIGRKHISGFYYAFRFLRDDNPLMRQTADGKNYWRAKLASLGPPGAPACRFAYRRSPNDGGKYEMAAALVECRGAKALLELAIAEGKDSMAERALAEFLMQGSMIGSQQFLRSPLHDPAVNVLVRDDSASPKEGKEPTAQTVRTRLRLGIYEMKEELWWSQDTVHVKDEEAAGAWFFDGCTVEIFRIGPDGQRTRVLMRHCDGD
jgi:hypothetical protein